MKELILERAKEPRWKNTARFERLSTEIHRLAKLSVAGQEDSSVTDQG